MGGLVTLIQFSCVLGAQRGSADTAGLDEFPDLSLRLRGHNDAGQIQEKFSVYERYRDEKHPSDPDVTLGISSENRRDGRPHEITPGSPCERKI